MLPAQGRNSGVVDARTSHPAFGDERTQFGPVLFRLCEQDQIRRFKPSVNLVERRGKRAWRIVDARMGDNSEKLVQAGPRNSPGRAAFGKVGQVTGSPRVEFRVPPVRVNQNVGVDRDHDDLDDEPPRPS